MRRWQLRMYRVQPGRMDDWVDEFRAHVRPLRESRGFTVLGPWVGDDELFVWIIGHEEFDAADAAYYTSPERTALDPDPARLLSGVQTFLLEER